MILRTVSCDVEGCNEHLTEIAEGQGFMGWGAIKGLKEEIKDDNGKVIGLKETAWLCPSHKAHIKRFLNGEYELD